MNKDFQFCSFCKHPSNLSDTLLIKRHKPRTHLKWRPNDLVYLRCREAIIREMENDARLRQRVFIDEVVELFAATCNLDGVTCELVVHLMVGLMWPRGRTHRRRSNDNSSESRDTPLISAPHLATGVTISPVGTWLRWTRPRCLWKGLVVGA